MSNPSEKKTTSKGVRYSRKPVSLPASFASVNVNNVMDKLVLFKQLDPKFNSTDQGPHIVAKAIKLIEVKEDGEEQEVVYNLEKALSID
jgi:hypothetical protein